VRHRKSPVEGDEATEQDYDDNQQAEDNFHESFHDSSTARQSTSIFHFKSMS